MARKREDPDGNGGQAIASYANAQVPFRDAATGDGELPLDSIDVFRIPARDNNGASDHCTFYAPPLMMRYMDIINHTHRFPYLNRGDFVRHAIARHVSWLIGIRGSVPRHLSSGIESMSEVCRDDEIQLQIQGILTKIRDTIERKIQAAEIGEAIQVINRLRGILDNVHDSNWTRRFRHEFMTRYGPYLQAPKAVAAADAEE